MNSSTQLSAPAGGAAASADAVAAGLPIPPIERIHIFGDSEWADSVLELAKGVRAIAYAAFNLALLKFCPKDQTSHPGVVLIDSPLVICREPDTDDGGFSHDYRSIAEDFPASQVIIFENEDPPFEFGADANIIRFTGASHGRQGFISKSA